MTSIFEANGDTISWRLATWSQRLRLGVFWIIMSSIVLVMVVVALGLFGAMVDGIGRHNAEHDRCLKQATNGYEIRQCR